MIRKLNLEGYRSFLRPQSVDLRRITLIYGPNACGKSAIIEALLSIKSIILENSKQPLGYYKRLLTWNGSESGKSANDFSSIRSKIADSNTSTGLDLDGTYKDSSLQGIRYIWSDHSSASSDVSTVELQAKCGKIIFDRLDDEIYETYVDITAEPALGTAGPAFYKLRDEESIQNFKHAVTLAGMMPHLVDFGSSDVISEDDIFEKIDLSKYVFHSFGSFFPQWGFGPSTDPNRTWPEIDSADSINYSHRIDENNKFSFLIDKDKREINPFSSFSSSLSGFLKDAHYVGPKRSIPSSAKVQDTNAQYGGVGRDGANIYSAILWEIYWKYGVDVMARINQILMQMKIPYSIELKEAENVVDGNQYYFALLDTRTGAVIQLRDVGCGIEQVLPIIVQGITGKLICIEQPELHLHPRMQADLMDYFIDSEKQWVIETHSEALMTRLQRRIRQGKIKASEVSVVYVHPTGEDGSVALPLRLDEYGAFIDSWPDGFFSETFEDIFGDL